MEFLFIEGVRGFTVCLLILFGLVAIETLMLLVGGHLSGFVDDLLPDLDVDADAPGDFSLGKAIGFVGFGRVPFLVVLMTFLGMAGSSGIWIQHVATSVTGEVMPLSLVLPAVLGLSVVFTSWATRLLEKVLPRDHTTAVSIQTFIGRRAVIVFGTATAATAAEAEIVDEHGRTHPVWVKAMNAEDVFEEGMTAVVRTVGDEDGFIKIAADSRSKNNN